MNIKKLVICGLLLLQWMFPYFLWGQTAMIDCNAILPDIELTCDDIKGTAIVNWNPPTGSGSCSFCPSDTFLVGYKFLGERGGHRYYLSNQATDWRRASIIAEALNGYLAVINDPAENNFLHALLDKQRVYIGLTDMKSEGTFYGVNGDTLVYTNWANAQPDNLAGEQHLVQFLPNGQWEDVLGMAALKYLVEIPCWQVEQTTGFLNGSSFPAGETHLVAYDIIDSCGNQAYCNFNITVKPTLSIHLPKDVNFPCQDGINGTSVFWSSPYATSCCDNCLPPEQDLEAFEYIGRYKGHQYYYSLDKATWQQADSISRSADGHLVTVNDAGENQLLANFLQGRLAYIGLADKKREGRFVWSTGESIFYENWHRGQPNNAGGAQDYVVMLGNGYWDDIYDNQQVNFIMEIPCLDIKRIDEGPARGSIFPTGTSTITYEATDNCGNTAQRSFNIYIGACQNPGANVCQAGAFNSKFFWIKQVQVGSINNHTGGDKGYKDYTHLSTSLSQKTNYTLTLTPGIANSAIDLYWRVFIDYNQDGDFYDSGETVFSYKNDGPVQVVFQVPATSKLGATTMRVAMRFGGTPSSCGTFTYGEVEDYTVQIMEAAFQDQSAKSRSGQKKKIIATEDPSEETMPTIIASPNPVTSELRIDVSKVLTNNTQLSIYNSLGQKIYQKPLLKNKQQAILLSVAHLKTGIYFISLDSDETPPILQKFIKL